MLSRLLTSLAATKKQDGKKVFLICLTGRNKKKRGKLSINTLAMLQYTNTMKTMGVSIYTPKIPEISV